MFAQDNKTSRFQIGKNIYNNGGYIGKRIIYLIHNIINFKQYEYYADYFFEKSKQKSGDCIKDIRL